MAQSLLAHLYPHIRGSQEDLATMSLQYIISQSGKLNMAFTKLLETALNSPISKTKLNYNCQSVGEQQERPDISGADENGKELVLCEAKFYAGLTDNQPNGYIDRLQKENGIGLVFLCPSTRKTSLWNKLIELCKDREVKEDGAFCVSVDNVKMSIITWNDVIGSLYAVAIADDNDSIHDILQLKGLCEKMDEIAFIPYSAEDFGTINAIREERHYQVIDALYKLLKDDKALKPDDKGLRATAYRNGYVIYIRILDYALSLYYDRKHWRDARTETPFWLCIQKQDTHWYQPEEFKRFFDRCPDYKKEMFGKNVALALNAPTNATLDEVAKELKKQVLQYIADIENALMNRID